MTDTEVLDTIYQLNNNDRCDRCGAQAFFLAEGMEGTLLFCGHHFKKSEKQIRSWAIRIVDELEKVK